MIPQNLLGAALSIIGRQQFKYIKFIGRTTNEIGLDVASYNTPVCMSGSVQAIARNLYAQYGLDLQKNYKMLYVSENVMDIERDVSGDQFIYAGQKYQCESTTDWFPMNGWMGILCVEVPNS